jgi:hypothetical protein
MVGHCSLPACYKAASRAPRRGEACIRPERSGRAASGNSWWDKFVGTFAVRRNSRSDQIGVGLDTVKQIESQLMQRNYEGFLK